MRGRPAGKSPGAAPEINTMRKSLLTVGLALAALSAIPNVAAARNYCERDKHDQKVVGTIVSALGGALLGDAVAGRGHRGDGALVGAAGGAIVGNQLSRSNARCPDDYYGGGYDGRGYDGGYQYEERRVYYAPPPPPPPPPHYYGYAAYYAPPPPPPVYEYRGWGRHHHDDDDDDGDGDHHGRRHWR